MNTGIDWTNFRYSDAHSARPEPACKAMLDAGVVHRAHPGIAEVACVPHRLRERGNSRHTWDREEQRLPGEPVGSARTAPVDVSNRIGTRELPCRR